MVRDHYAKLGFSLLDSDPDGTMRWELMSDATAREAPMRVRREGLQLAAE
jgi:hypothetical protein